MVNNYKKSKKYHLRSKKNGQKRTKNGGMFRTASQQIRKAMNHGVGSGVIRRKLVALGRKVAENEAMDSIHPNKDSSLNKVMKKIKLDREIEYDPLVFSDHIDPIPRSVTSPVATTPVTIPNTRQIPKPVVLHKKSKG